MKLHENSTIAIMDSGIGGVSILKQMIERFGGGNYIYYADNLHMPYGNKSKNKVAKRVDEIINILQKIYKVDLIIIACNTASASIDKSKYKNILTLTFEKNKNYFATSLTKKNLPDHSVISDSSLATQIEKNILNQKVLEKIVKRHIKIHKLARQDSIVLGCTHFELARKIFEKYCPKTIIENNSQQIIDQIDNFAPKYLNVIFLQSKNSNNHLSKLRAVLKMEKF